VVGQHLALEAMREAIRKLEQRDQQLLFFRHHEHLTVKEIAEVFGVTPGRISQLYNAIVVKLRALMKVDVTVYG
jgi:RNA polymerase sigma factor (sigma-70 family)